MEGEKKESTFNQLGYQFDLAQILKRGKLIVLAENSSTSYFLYREKEMGFEYEVLREFAQELGVELEIKIIENLDYAIDELNAGNGDILACNLTVTRERANKMDFSVPIIAVQQVLIQRKPNPKEHFSEPLLREASQLAKKKVTVWKQSSYYDRLISLQEEIGDTIYIKEEDGLVGSEELIELVSEGIIDYTVVEENVAKINQSFFGNIDIHLPLSAKQKIAFGLRKSSPILKAKLDNWLDKFTNTAVYKYIYHKYYELSPISIHTPESSKPTKKGDISAYDQYFRAAGLKNNIDWRWLAALSYQESKFNPDAVSFGGAYSMMQFMPEIGPIFGVHPDSPPEVQIMGGGRKLKKDLKSWTSIPDYLQRMKFALASYNCGKAHVLDAQRLAEKYGKDPTVWDENVEEMILKLSKREFYGDPVVRYGSMRGIITYKYVQEIYDRFLHYTEIYK
jgi:membrane-bound lytic murein transglycosylase F